MTSMLSAEQFAAVVRDSPLVSLDLVVVNEVGHALLGRRLNRPAQGYWFVPGGRVRKDEPIGDAFRRLTREELGCEIPLAEASLLGPFEHFYHDNFAGEEFSTHYVVLGYLLILPSSRVGPLPQEQHGEYRWFPLGELLQSCDVHEYTKLYFKKGL